MGKVSSCPIRFATDRSELQGIHTVLLVCCLRLRSSCRPRKSITSSRPGSGSMGFPSLKTSIESAGRICPQISSRMDCSAYN